MPKIKEKLHESEGYASNEPIENKRREEELESTFHGPVYTNQT